MRSLKSSLQLLSQRSGSSSSLFTFLHLNRITTIQVDAEVVSQNLSYDVNLTLQRAVVISLTLATTCANKTPHILFQLSFQFCTFNSYSILNLLVNLLISSLNHIQTSVNAREILVVLAILNVLNQGTYSCIGSCLCSSISSSSNSSSCGDTTLQGINLTLQVLIVCTYGSSQSVNGIVNVVLAYSRSGQSVNNTLQSGQLTLQFVNSLLNLVKVLGSSSVLNLILQTLNGILQSLDVAILQSGDGISERLDGSLVSRNIASHSSNAGGSLTEQVVNLGSDVVIGSNQTGNSSLQVLNVTLHSIETVLKNFDLLLIVGNQLIQSVNLIVQLGTQSVDGILSLLVGSLHVSQLSSLSLNLSLVLGSLSLSGANLRTEHVNLAGQSLLNVLQVLGDGSQLSSVLGSLKLSLVGSTLSLLGSSQGSVGFLHSTASQSVSLVGACSSGVDAQLQLLVGLKQAGNRLALLGDGGVGSSNCAVQTVLSISYQRGSSCNSSALSLGSLNVCIAICSVLGSFSLGSSIAGSSVLGVCYSIVDGYLQGSIGSLVSTFQA